MARQLRDAQCHTIWEGTENILLPRRAARHARTTARTRRSSPASERALDGADAGPRSRRSSTQWRRRCTTRRDADRAPRRGVDRAAAPPRAAVRAPARGPRRGRAASSTRRRGSSTATATRARRSWRGGSRRGGSRRRAVRGILDDDRTVDRPVRRDRPLRAGRAGRGRLAAACAAAAPPPSGASRPSWSSPLDEHLGPPVDSYVNGTQTWLTDDGPGGATLEWRLHPVASYRPPAGVSHYDLWDVVVGELAAGADPDVPRPGRRAPAAHVAVGRPRVLPRVRRRARAGAARRRAATAALGIAPDAVGLVDHDRIGDEWERAGGRCRSWRCCSTELETA